MSAAMLVRKAVLAALGLFCLLPIAACAADDSGDQSEEYEDEPVGETNDELRSAVSCKEKTATAYDDGKPFSITTITVGGKLVSKPTGHAFLKMQAAADKAGVRLSLTSGFRTMAEQQALYRCYKTKKCNNGNLAAEPGYSNHQNGLAVDVSTSTWLAKNAKKYGFARTVPSESWHYEYFGGRDPGGPCTNAIQPADDGDDVGEVAPEKLDWVGIREDSSFAMQVPLKVKPVDSAIVKVVYRSGNFELGTSTNAADNFPVSYTFSAVGERTLTAEGYDSTGKKISVNAVDVTITN